LTVVSLRFAFDTRKHLRKSDPDQKNRPFVASVRMVRDMLSSDSNTPST